jgi:hypothetical protein
MQDRPEFLMIMGVFPLICISIDTTYPIYKRKENSIDDTSETYTHICVPTKSVAETLEITRQLLAKLPSIHPKNVFFANFIKYRNPNPIDDNVLKELKELPRIIPPEYNYYDWCGFMLPNFIKKRKLSIHLSTEISVDKFLERLYYSNKLNEFSVALMDDDALRKFSDAFMKGKDKGDLYNSIRKCLLAVRGITQDQHDQLTITEGGRKRSYRTRRLKLKGVKGISFRNRKKTRCRKNR